MKLLKNALMLIGLISVVSTLVFAVQQSAEPAGEATRAAAVPESEESQDKNVSPAYRISAIDIPGDLNFAGEPVPQDDPEIMERVDREFLVNTYWQSNALLLMKRAHKYFPVIEPILAKNGVPEDFKYLAVAESGLENVVSPAGATGRAAPARCGWRVPSRSRHRPSCGGCACRRTTRRRVYASPVR